MAINIYKDELTFAQLFYRDVLFTGDTIFRDEVPEGWHCYDLCGSDQKPDKPQDLVDSSTFLRIGTVLSPTSLKRPSTRERKVKNQYFISRRTLTLADFCDELGLPVPQDTRKYIPRPASEPPQLVQTAQKGPW